MVNILLITSDKHHYEELKNTGEFNITYFDSIAVARMYFKDKEEYIKYYNFMIIEDDLYTKHESSGAEAFSIFYPIYPAYVYLPPKSYNFIPIIVTKNPEVMYHIAIGHILDDFDDVYNYIKENIPKLEKIIDTPLPPIEIEQAKIPMVPYKFEDIYIRLYIPYDLDLKKEFEGRLQNPFLEKFKDYFKYDASFKDYKNLDVSPVGFDNDVELLLLNDGDNYPIDKSDIFIVHRNSKIFEFATEIQNLLNYYNKKNILLANYTLDKIGYYNGNFVLKIEYMIIEFNKIYEKKELLLIMSKGFREDLNIHDYVKLIEYLTNIYCTHNNILDNPNKYIFFNGDYGNISLGERQYILENLNEKIKKIYINALKLLKKNKKLEFNNIILEKVKNNLKITQWISSNDIYHYKNNIVKRVYCINFNIYIGTYTIYRYDERQDRLEPIFIKNKDNNNKFNLLRDLDDSHINDERKKEIANLINTIEFFLDYFNTLEKRKKFQEKKLLKKIKG